MEHNKSENKFITYMNNQFQKYPYKIAVFILLIWFVYGCAVVYFRQKATLGTMGDAFGALNTLFTGLAFAGLVVSIYLQRQELQETREELRGQRKAQEAQAEVVTQQLKLLDKTHFDDTFFKLLDNLRRQKEYISFNPTTFFFNSRGVPSFPNNNIDKHKLNTNYNGNEAIKMFMAYWLVKRTFDDSNSDHQLVIDLDYDIDIFTKHAAHIDLIYQFIDQTSNLIDIDIVFYRNLLNQELSSQQIELCYFVRIFSDEKYHSSLSANVFYLYPSPDFNSLIEYCSIYAGLYRENDTFPFDKFIAKTTNYHLVMKKGIEKISKGTGNIELSNFSKHYNVHNSIFIGIRNLINKYNISNNELENYEKWLFEQSEIITEEAKEYLDSIKIVDVS